MFRELPPKGADGPRALTPDMAADANHAGRMMRIMGGVWGILGFAMAAVAGIVLSNGNPSTAFLLTGLALGLGGVAVWAWGRRKASRHLERFRSGDEARGEVVSVARDPMQKINNKRPWKVRYRYDVASATHEGSMTYWTDDPPEGLEVGREIIVLHAPESPERSLLWAGATPPTPDEGESHARARIASTAWQADPYAANAEAEAEAEAETEAEPEPAAKRRRRS